MNVTEFYRLPVTNLVSTNRLCRQPGSRKVANGTMSLILKRLQEEQAREQELYKRSGSWIRANTIAGDLQILWLVFQ